MQSIPEHREVLDHRIDVLSSLPVIVYPKFGMSSVLHTGASAKGLDDSVPASGWKVEGCCPCQEHCLLGRRTIALSVFCYEIWYRLGKVNIDDVKVSRLPFDTTAHVAACTRTTVRGDSRSYMGW